MEEAIAALLRETREDASVFGQRIVVSVLAFLFLLFLYNVNVISWSLAREVQALLDGAILAWLVWAIPLTIFRKTEWPYYVGALWNALQHAVLLTFPFFAVVINVFNWNMNPLLFSPATMVVVGALTLIDAGFSAVRAVSGKRPNYVLFSVNVLTALQGVVLMMMGTYYTRSAYLGDYYRMLWEYLIRG